MQCSAMMAKVCISLADACGKSSTAPSSLKVNEENMEESSSGMHDSAGLCLTSLMWALAGGGWGAQTRGGRT